MGAFGFSDLEKKTMPNKAWLWLLFSVIHRWRALNDAINRVSRADRLFKRMPSFSFEYDRCFDINRCLWVYLGDGGGGKACCSELKFLKALNLENFPLLVCEACNFDGVGGNDRVLNLAM